MKRTLYASMVLVLFSIFTVGAEAFAAKSLYDDFSGTYIDSEKWRHREFVREVDAGELVSKIGNASGTGRFTNNTSFIDPASISTIECDLTVVATNLDTGSEPSSFVRIGGFFYNTQGSGGATGDIFAGAYIGDRGNGGLEAYWYVVESLNDDRTNWEEKGSGTLVDPGTLTYGTAYTAKIEYDETTNQFTFTVAGGAPYSFTTGPARQRAAVTPFKGMTTGIDANGGTGTGYASALFDNVYINNQATAYDDFSTPPTLNQTNWQNLEFVREIADGKLRLNVQADGSRTDATLAPNDQTTAYLEAKVLVESGSKVSTGASATARIAGFYYNESRGPGSGQDYNGHEHDVWVRNHIELDEFSNLRAACIAYRYDTPAGGPGDPGTMLFSRDFTTEIDIDTAYTLSIEFTGSTLIFKCNDETYQYDITTPTYPPSEGQHRQLRSRVYADPGESAYMKAGFDDVYVMVTKEEKELIVIPLLEGYLGFGDKWLEDRIEKTIEHIQKSLAPKLWETDETLTMKGKKVFDEEKKAVKELMKIDGLDVADIIDSLAGIDKRLARTAIDQAMAEAKAAGCNDEGNNDPECDKTLKEFDKAEREMDKAQKELDQIKKDGTPDPKYNKAIDHYKKAWEHAQKAMKKVPEPEEESE